MPSQVLDRFLAAKAKVDTGAGANAEEQENIAIDALHALTSVRALLVSGLQSGELNRLSIRIFWGCASARVQRR